MSKEWKDKLKDENYNNKPKNKQSSTYYYSTKSVDKKSYITYSWALKKIPTIKAEEKWKKEFPQQEMNWSQFYQMSFSCTVDVKLKLGISLINTL